MHRILILGAGFGGIATALGLRERLAADDEIVLAGPPRFLCDGSAQELGHRRDGAARGR